MLGTGMPEPAPLVLRVVPGPPSRVTELARRAWLLGGELILRVGAGRRVLSEMMSKVLESLEEWRKRAWR